MTLDVNDIHRERGLDAVRGIMDGARPVQPRKPERPVTASFVGDLRPDVPIDAYSESLTPKQSEADLKKRSRELRKHLMRAGDAAPVLTSQYVVKGWLGMGSFSCLYGPSNVGKTFVVVDIGCAVALGEEWAGHRTTPGTVVYVAAEGGNGILNRLAAVRKQRPALAHADFYCLRAPVDIHGDVDPGALCELIRPLKPSLLIIDTLARSMGDGDENSTKDMSQFVKGCDFVREETGAHVMVVHHTGKDETRGARGSYALFAAVDTEISVTKEREIHCTKVRDFVTPEPIGYSLVSVTLGDDQDGDPVTSCTVKTFPIEREETVKEPKRFALTGQEKVAWEALDAALQAHGQRYTNSDDYPNNVDVVDLSYWKDECLRRSLTDGDSDSAQRNAFHRVKKGLINKNHVRIMEDRVWRCFDE